MNKAAKYSINGALLLGIGNAFCNAANQFSNKTKHYTLNWSELLNAFGKGALVGGAGGLILGALRDNNMNEMLIDAGGTTGLIKEILDNNTISEISFPNKAQRVQHELSKEFYNDLSEYPTLSGSTIKGTAIQNSDIDVLLKFNKYSGTIENIRDKVENYLKDKFYDKNLIKIRSQNHSIGLFFEINGMEKRIDIIPMREVNNANGDTYLFSTERNTIKKTNVQKQANKFRFTEKQRQIIKILKSWKIDNDLYFPSILIEHIVLRAFKENTVPSRIDKSLLFLITYIARNITRIRIVDPANSNNIISDSLTIREKEHLRNFCHKMIEDVTNDERNLIDYFAY